MLIYLVFGDPRREEDRRVFTATVDSKSVRRDSGIVTIAHQGTTVSGALLAEDQTTTTPEYLSVLVEETLPTANAVTYLHKAGWADFDGVPPVPQRLPFRAELTVLSEMDDFGPQVWKQTMWLDEPFAPMQRLTLHTGPGQDIAMRCLAMAPTPGDHPQALLTVDGDEPYRAWAEHRWQRVPAASIPPLWQDLQRVSDAVEASVVYLLGATIVTEAVLHDVDRLQPDDLVRLLPQDVAEATRDALVEAGREDLIPEPYRAETATGTS